MSGLKGYISQIIGPVVDVHFDLNEEESVKLGKFQGYETIAYVESIMSLYNAFCTICPSI